MTVKNPRAKALAEGTSAVDVAAAYAVVSEEMTWEEGCARRIAWLKSFPRRKLPELAKLLRRRISEKKGELPQQVIEMLTWTADQADAMHAGKLDA